MLLYVSFSRSLTRNGGVLADARPLTQLLCSLASFFNAHTMTRTFSNSTETALTTLAFAWWPWEESEDTERERKRAEEIKGHEKET